MQWKTEMYFKPNKSGGRSAVFWERVPDSPHTVIFVLGTEIRAFPDLDGSWHHTRPDMYFDTEKRSWNEWFDLMTGVKYSTFIVSKRTWTAVSPLDFLGVILLTSCLTVLWTVIIFCVFLYEVNHTHMIYFHIENSSSTSYVLVDSPFTPSP